MKDMNELALVAMADPVHRPRKPVADSPKSPPAQPSTDAGLHAVFDSSGEALVLIDSAGVIQRANRRARDLLRLKDASIRRQGLRDLLPKQSGPELSLWCAQKTPPGLQTLE